MWQISKFAVFTLALPAEVLCAASSQDKFCSFNFPVSLLESSTRAANVTNVDGEWSQVRSSLYKTDLSGYKDISEQELASINANYSEGQRGCRPSTFGELDATRIFENPAFELSPSDVVADLGSGVGQAVISAVLFFNASRAVGIELSKERYQRSCAALERLTAVLHSDACGDRCRARVASTGQIKMQNENLLDIDMSQFTRVIMYANCFPYEVQAALQKKLLQELPLGALVHTTDNQGWDKQLVLAGRTLALIPRSGMLLYKVEEAKPMDDLAVLAAYLEKAAKESEGIPIPGHKEL